MKIFLIYTFLFQTEASLTWNIDFSDCVLFPIGLPVCETELRASVPSSVYIHTGLS